MVSDPVKLISHLNLWKASVDAFSLKQELGTFLAITDRFSQETLKQVTQKVRTVSQAALRFTYNSLTSNKVSMKKKVTVVFATIVLGASMALRSTIPLIMMSPIIGAAAGSAALIYILATKVGPLFIQWIAASQNRTNQARPQQQSSSNVALSPMPKNGPDPWAVEFRNMPESPSPKLSSDQWVKEFDHLDAQDWILPFEQTASEKALEPQEVSKAAWPSEFAAASDTIERDVQAFQAHQEHRTNGPQNPHSARGTLRAIAILRHLVTPASQEERVQQAVKVRKAKHSNIKSPSHQSGTLMPLYSAKATSDMGRFCSDLLPKKYHPIKSTTRETNSQPIK